MVDEDGRAVVARNRPIGVTGRFEAGRPAGLKPGTPLSVPLAINFPSLPVTPGKSYSWLLTIDGESQPAWRVTFYVKAPPA